MSGRSIRAFLDANNIVSGILFHGNEATLLELGYIHAVKLVTNRYVMEEVSAVLSGEEFKLTQDEVEGLKRYLHQCLEVIEDPPIEQVQRNKDLLKDKKDIPVALGALNTKADYLVTGDGELLASGFLPSITTKNLLKKILP